MNRLSTTTFALAATLALVASAQAGVTPSGSNGWQAFPGSLNSNSPTRPYWDNASMDGGNRNIGNWISNTYTPSLPGGSVANSGPTSMQWWGRNSIQNTAIGPDSNAAQSISFTKDLGTTMQATLLTEVAGYSPYNEIGWYDTTAAAGSEVLNPIFSGAMSPVVTVNFTPSANWGLYIRSHASYPSSATNGWLFFSESLRNRTVGFTGDAVAGQQHFAVFAQSLSAVSEKYVVGVEDLTINNSGIECMGDYNDSIFTLQVVPAPSVGALAALGGLVAARRRRA